MSSQTFTQGRSLFDPQTGYGQSSIFAAQINVSMPNQAGLDTATNLLVPDRLVEDRLAHFFEELYDLRPQSHLVRFLKALLGDSGCGQLRKRMLLYRLQVAMTSTHFYDLDAFYGSLFGAHRNPEETLPVNPLTDTITSDEWDALHGADTKYRERVMHLARAIPLGATVPGIQTAAEAIFGCECDVYEVWALLDRQGNAVPPVFGGRRWSEIEAAFHTWGNVANNHTYSFLEMHRGPQTTQGNNRIWSAVEVAFPTWADASKHTYSEIELALAPSTEPAVGSFTHSNRAEFIVRPKKKWDTPQQHAAEDWSALRVLDVLKPAGSFLTIDAEGVALHNEVPLNTLVADSNFWEVSTQVAPKVKPVGKPGALYPTSPLAKTAPSDTHVLPRYAFTEVQGASISFNPEIVSVRTYAQTPTEDTLSPINFESVTYFDGLSVDYTGERALLTPRQVLASQYANDGVLVAAPYSQSRSVAVPHT